MIKIILSGCNGRMGQVVTALVANGLQRGTAERTAKIVAGIDKDARHLADYPVFQKPVELLRCADPEIRVPDVVVDFSLPAALDGLLEYGVTQKVPLILCATGYSKEQIADIEEASKKIPVFRSGNMSVGINLLADLVARACSVLGRDFDVEIVERHHRLKADAPSGTALMLADAASSALPYKPDYVYERESVRQPRGENEIGISAVRGGTVVGVHDVILAGPDEVIELRHSAASRDVFATGALKAAEFIIGKPAGLYSMKDVLENKTQT